MALWSNPSEAPGEDGYRPLDEINVTPMVDVMLVLLVIFMVTAPLLAVSVPIDLPKTDAAKLSEPKNPIIVSIAREGDIFIGDERVASAVLKTRLDKLAAEDPGRVVYVRGDRRLDYGRIMDLLGIVNTAGFAQVSLIAEAAKPQ